MTDRTDRLGDDSGEHAATRRLGPDDSDEHEATQRLGADDSGEHSATQRLGDEESDALRRATRPTLPLKQKASPDKLKAMLARSRAISERPTVLETELPSATLPSLDVVEADAEDTDELDALVDDAEMMTHPSIDIGELTAPGAPALDLELEPIVEITPDSSPGLVSESSPQLSSDSDAAAYDINEPLAPSGEYGLMPGIGEKSRSGEHPTPQPVNRNPRLVVVATLAVGVFAVVISISLIVQNWLTPQRAMIWIGAAALASTLLTGLVAPWEHDGGPQRTFMVRVLPGLMFTCAALILSSTWSVAEVRAFAVDFASDDVSSMERILDDPSDDVAAAGCARYMAHQDDPTWWGRMLSIVAARPRAASRCMRNVAPELQASVAGSLIDRWSRELLSDDALGEERACGLALGLTQLPVEPAVMSAPLLDCTLSASSETTQACCGDALASTVSEPAQWAARLSAAAARIEGEQTPSGVFSMAFQQDSLTAAQKKFAEAVKFDGVMGRGAALALVCETMSADQDAVIRHLRAVLDGECDLDVGQLPTKIDVWEPICEATKVEVEADRTRPPVDTLCEITRETVVPEAIETARRLMTLAAIQQDEKMAEGVHAGYNQLIANFGASGEFATTSPMALSGEERHRAMMARSTGEGSVVFIKDKERRKFERNLDPQSRKELREWEKRRAERMTRPR